MNRRPCDGPVPAPARCSTPSWAPLLAILLAAFATGLAWVAAVAPCVAAGEDPVVLNRRWAEQAFATAAASQQQPENSLLLIREGFPGDTKIGRCAAGGPLRLGEKVYRRGIGVNSHSVLRVVLAQPAARLVATIGLDRNADGTAASVVFHVVVDGKDAFTSKRLRPNGQSQAIDVPLGGARRFDLVVDDGGDGRSWDQGDWADAKVVLQDGRELWLDELVRDWEATGGLPFSFVYGGRPSTGFIDQWKRTVEEKQLDATRRQRCLTLTDPATGLELRAEATIYTDTPGVDWTLHFTNRGKKETPLLEQVKAVDVRVATGVEGPVTLHRLVGSPCRVDDWAPLKDVLAPGKSIEFAPAAGRSSNAACPFFNLQWKGGGVITAVGWSGQWAARVGHSGRVATIQAGMQNLRLKLRPGESIRSPRILQLYWSGDDPFTGHNLFRRTMLAHVVPRIDGRPATPPIAHLSTSFYELNGSTEANVLSHLESIRGLGFEVFWLDAYWTKGGFPRGMGNYGFPLERVEPRDRFPGGLKVIGKAAHEAGMGYLMWFEPERVHRGTYIAREYPDWVISPAGDGSGHLDLGNPEAREHITKYLIAAVKEYRLTWMRIDYNIDPLPFWQFLDKQSPDRVGMAEIRYIEGLYRLWDDVRAAHPQLMIDNCSSGGRRIDLETCSRSIPLWRTDATIDPLFRKDFNQAALQNQLMTAGLSRYVPFSVSGQMGATPYLFRSGSNAGIAFCEDCRAKDYPRELLRGAIEEAKRLRPYYFGDFYTLSRPTASPADWCVLQYHRPEEQDGMVLAFRRHRSPYVEFACKLRGIDPAANYEVATSRGYDRTPPVRMPGSELGKLSIRVDACPGSAVVEYKKTPK